MTKKGREQVKITSNYNNSQVFYLFKYHFSFHLCKLQLPMHNFLQWRDKMNERTSKIRIAFTVLISSPTTMILLSKTHENLIQTLILIFSFQQQIKLFIWTESNFEKGVNKIILLVILTWQVFKIKCSTALDLGWRNKAPRSDEQSRSKLGSKR